MSDFPKVEVTVTFNNKFKATIQKSESTPVYAVIVGSEAWEEGYGREFEPLIRQKCNDVVLHLFKQLI